MLDVTKLKAFADKKLNVTQMMISVFDRVENTVGKGENASYQHILLFPQCFQKASFLGVVKSRGLCGTELKLVVVAFPLSTQDYGNSTTTCSPVSG